MSILDSERKVLKHRYWKGVEVENHIYRLTVVPRDDTGESVIGYEQYDIFEVEDAYPGHQMAVRLLLIAHRGPDTTTEIEGIGKVDEDTEYGPLIHLEEW